MDETEAVLSVKDGEILLTLIDDKGSHPLPVIDILSTLHHMIAARQNLPEYEGELVALTFLSAFVTASLQGAV